MNSLNSNGTVEDTILYQYSPSEPSAQAFVILFSLITVTHMVVAVIYNTPYFVPMVIGGIMQTCSYYGRLWSHDDPTNTGAYVLYLLLTLAAAPFLAATNYMTLSQIMASLHATHISPISVRSLTATFIIVDVIIFIASTSGVGLQVTEDETLAGIGSKIVITGLAVQIVCLSFFAYVVGIFQVHYSRSLTLEEKRNAFGNWAKYLWPMYVACVSLIVRNAFRIGQFAQGQNGLVAHDEWFIYVFDAAPLWLMMVVFVAVHPGRLAKRVRPVALVIDDLSVEEAISQHSIRVTAPA